jgi:tetratricopeptide (TPR) repeat protein
MKNDNSNTPHDNSEITALLNQAAQALRERNSELAQQLLRDASQREPNNEHIWILLARSTKDFGDKLTCLEKALLLDPTNFSTWRSIVEMQNNAHGIGDILRSVEGQRVYLEARAMLAQRGIVLPDEIRHSLHFSNESDTLERIEWKASQLRKERGNRRVEFEGAPIKDFRDWIVTTYGVESTIRQYPIVWQRVWEGDWEDHIEQKEGYFGSQQDFIRAIKFARDFFPNPKTGSQGKMFLDGRTSNRSFSDGRIHTAINGLKVRSKSEVIIANLLIHRGIPFDYEKTLFASDNTRKVPDFTIYYKNHEIYIEHLGMLYDPKYLSNWHEKHLWYQDNNLDKRLIITTEAEGIDCIDILKQIENRANEIIHTSNDEYDDDQEYY